MPSFDHLQGEPGNEARYTGLFELAILSHGQPTTNLITGSVVSQSLHMTINLALVQSDWTHTFKAGEK